jgi:hypothetical protein
MLVVQEHRQQAEASTSGNYIGVDVDDDDDDR